MSFNPKDLPEPAFSIGIARGCGLNKSKIADSLNLSRPTIYKYLKEEGEFIEFVAARVKTMVSQSIAEGVAAAKEIRERQYLKSLKNIDEFLDPTQNDNDGLRYRASVDTIDRQEGKAIQRLEETSTVNHTHRVLLPAAELNAMRALIQESTALMLPAGQPVIEGEVVEDDEEDS